MSSHVLNLQSQLSAEQKKSALPSVPSLLEVCGFSYFYGGFLVGPQFTLRSYQKLLAGELTDSPGKPPNRYKRETITSDEKSYLYNKPTVQYQIPAVCNIHR